MKRLYAVTMEDGSKWGVPAEIIAKNRAEYYAGIDKDTDYRLEFEAMINWFDKGDISFSDWAKDNMDWDDVKEYAEQIHTPPKEVDWQDGWVNGECEFLILDDDE